MSGTLQLFWSGQWTITVVLGQEQRADLAAAVQKTACDLALRVLTRTRGSIGADIAGVDAEVSHLRADLENAKEDLQRTNTELAAVQAEANRFSLTLTGVKHDLDRQGRTCKSLEEQSRSCAELCAVHEAQRVPEVVSRFLATTAEEQLQQPEITGLAVPVAFTLHVPVQHQLVASQECDVAEERATMWCMGAARLQCVVTTKSQGRSRLWPNRQQKNEEAGYVPN